MPAQEHVANIGTGEKRKRLTFGIFMLVVATILLATFLVFEMNRWWRLVLILPVWLGGVGIFQVKEET